MLAGTVQPTLGSTIPEHGCMALERAFKTCEERAQRPATNLDVCEELGINLRELYALLDRYRGIGLGFVDDYAATAGEKLDGPLIKYIPNPEQQEIYGIWSRSEFRVAMIQAIDALPKNEKLVVSLYHNEDLTMQEIAEIFGISEARVAQIHTTAMLRVRGKLISLKGLSL